MPVYTIHKGIDKPLEFKGFKAQYITYLGLVTLALLGIYALLQILGLSVFLSLLLTGVSGSAAFAYLYRISQKYGAKGLERIWASKRLPTRIRVRSYRFFKRHVTNA